MKIQKNVFEEIIKAVPYVPPESGGIIGGTNQVVTHFVLDNGTFLSNGYDIYAPDTLFLNNTIQRWKQDGIDFYGVFHCHFSNSILLSNGDKRYITQIMNAMPQYINKLYFPIIFPRENMIVYRADRVGKDICLASEDIELY